MTLKSITYETFFAYLRYAAAEMDCMTALTLDPLYVKAYLRLGSAQFLMKKLQKAKETFEKVLQLEPQNKQAKLEIEKIEKVCRLCWLEMFYNQMLSLHGGSCLYEAIHVSLSHIYFNSQMLYFVVHTDMMCIWTDLGINCMQMLSLHGVSCLYEGVHIS